MAAVSPTQVARQILFADLDLRMPVHGTKKDIIPVLDTDAVKNAVKNLVLTNFFERPFDPFKGGNLRALLFEPANGFTISALESQIRRVIEEHEPRVNRISVNITDNSDRNEYRVSIIFNISGIPNRDTTLDFQLRRLR